MDRVGLLSCAFVLCLLFASGSGCGGGKPGAAPAPGDVAESIQPAGGPAGRDPGNAPSLKEAIAAAGDCELPRGVDPALWDELTAELRRVLQARAACQLSPHPPEGEVNRVTDLRIETGQYGVKVLVWTYVNVGDYDLNGEVNIADLTPIGLHYGATAGSPDWDAAQLADGDGNGEVNIADVTPLGQHLLTTVDHYNVHTSDAFADYAADTTATVLGTREYPEAPPTHPPAFAYPVDLGADPVWFWVRPADALDAQGIASNFTPNYPPVIENLYAQDMVSPLQESVATCTATDPESGPLTYQWYAELGEIEGTGSAVTYIAPGDDSVLDTIHCKVLDDHDQWDSATTSVYVHDPDEL